MQLAQTIPAASVLSKISSKIRFVILASSKSVRLLESTYSCENSLAPRFFSPDVSEIMTTTEQLILDQIARTRADVLTLQTMLAALVETIGISSDKAPEQMAKNTAVLYDAVADQMARILPLLKQDDSPVDLPPAPEQR